MRRILKLTHYPKYGGGLLKFQWGVGGAQPPSTVNGFDVTLLIDVCKAIVTAEAEGKLHKQQDKIAKQAHIILGASAKAGIKGLVCALAGYNPTSQEVIEAFKLYRDQTGVASSVSP